MEPELGADACRAGLPAGWSGALAAPFCSLAFWRRYSCLLAMGAGL